MLDKLSTCALFVVPYEIHLLTCNGGAYCSMPLLLTDTATTWPRITPGFALPVSSIIHTVGPTDGYCTRAFLVPFHPF